MNAPLHVVHDRSSFLGGSDIAAVLGLSEWKTPLQLWMEKTGQAEEQPMDPGRERILRRGKRMEPIVLEMMQDERDLSVIARNKRYNDPEHSFMAAEIDAEALIGDEHVNIEIKTAHPFTTWKYGDEGTDEIPVAYAAQCAWGQMITGRAKTLVGVLFGADNLVVYEMARDPEIEVAMREQALHFWNHNVLQRIPPDPKSLPDVMRLLRKAPASKTEASAEIAELCAELERAKQAKAAAEDREVEVKYQIGRFVLGETGILLGNGGKLLPTEATKPGMHLITIGGSPLLTIAMHSQTRIDSDRLKLEHPEIAAACVKTNSFFTFAKPRRKK
jgi:putative phage-type endonuclease